MGKLKRMTEEEFEAINKQYNDLTDQIHELRAKRAKIKRRIDGYIQSLSRENMRYKQGKAYTMFGKRLKDCTPEEVREYRRIMTAESRANNKQV